MEVLEGVPEEDAKLIRHLTWLYGGYSMRARKNIDFSEEEFDDDYLLQSKSENSKNKDGKIKKAKEELQKSSKKQTSDEDAKEVIFLNGTDSPESGPSLSDQNEVREIPPLKSDDPHPLDTSQNSAETDEMDKTSRETESPVVIEVKDPFEEYYVRLVDTLFLDRRRPRWANGLSLKDKINKFLETAVATATEVCDGTPTTLSICNQFELSNHETMVADADRVHYYRAAMFWTGFNECKIENGAYTSPSSERAGVNSISPPDITGCDHIEKPTKPASVEKEISHAGDQLVPAGRSPNDISNYYCSNRRVLEIGTGPMCVLAMNALNAGAKYVDALEVSNSAARLASKLMAAYGFSNKIKVFNCHSKNFFFDTKSFFGEKLEDQSENCEIELPPDPPYDMIISEILGDFSSQEGVADVFLDLQRRILFNSPDYISKVKSIPMAAATKFVPCVFPDADNVVNKAAVHEHTTIFTPSFKMLQSVGLRIDNLPLCEEWQPIEELFFEQWMQPQMCQHYENMFYISSIGAMCGFLSGIDVEIRKNEHFGTMFGHCDSWYTNVILLDREYQVYPGDVVLTRSIANLTNYLVSNCFRDKIQVSRPSYSIRSYILGLVRPGDFMVEDKEVFTYEEESLTNKFCCPHLSESTLVPVKSIGRKALSELTVDVINTPCFEPEDFLKGFDWVRIGGNLYRVRFRPPVVTVDYNEQTCAAAAQPPSLKRKTPTDPPRRYKKVRSAASIRNLKRRGQQEGNQPQNT